MAAPEAQLVLAGRRIDRADLPEFAVRGAGARAAVAARGKGCDQDGAVIDLGPELDDHLGQLRVSQSAHSYFAEGWTVKVVDLAKVCALQPVVFSDHAEERAAVADRANIASLASITLPLPSSTGLPAQYDAGQNTWMIASRNPNLRLVGNFSGELQPGAIGFGFIVSMLASYVQVARFRGRYVLRDGYHRSLGLLMRGIREVPVFVRDYSQFEDLGLAQGMLSQAAYLGEQPPMLMDYLNDDVSAAVTLPASQKMIVIHGMEINPLG